MTSASDEKWRPFNCFFSRVGLRTYQHPCISALCVYTTKDRGTDPVSLDSRTSSLYMPWRCMGKQRSSSIHSWPKHYKNMVSFMPRSLYSRRNWPVSHWIQFCVGFQNQTRGLGQEKNSFLVPGIERRFLGRPCCRLVFVSSHFRRSL